MPPVVRLICICTFLFAGCIFVATALIFHRRRNKREARCQSSAWGTVTAIHFGRPVYTYRAGGRELAHQSHYSCRPSPFRVGQRVTVLYDPEDPEVCCVEEERRLTRFFVAIFLIVGLGCLIFPVPFLLFLS